MRKPRLTDFSSNTYSQFGEDGILAEILKRLHMERGVCVEFGAWDGIHHANTAKLWKDLGWRAVLIEADGERFKTLLEKTKDHDCVCLHEMVGNSGASSLESILTRSQIEHVDILSIDIDGDDWYVFESLEKLKPRIILCEYNPTMPPEASLVGDTGSRFGCSIRALTELAERKGYALVAITDTNGIFVRKEDESAFSDLETSFDVIALRKHNINLITNYDGDYVLSQKPAYGMRIAARKGLARDRVYFVEEQRSPFYWLRRWVGSLRRGSKNA